MEREKSPIRIESKLNDFIQSSEERRIDLTVNGYSAHWEILNSSLYGPEGISRDFFDTLNFANYTSKENADLAMSLYLKNNFKNKKDGITFVEMGGPGERLARDIDGICKIKKSFGITLQMGVDKAIYQNQFDPNDIPEYHKVITGDMFLNGTFCELKENLKEDKIDLLIERMRGGTEFLGDATCYPAWYYRNLNSWYRLMSDNGIMFIEVPELLHVDFPYIEKWFEKMKKTDGIIFRNNMRRSYFRIHKLQNAPQSLPSPHSVIKNQVNGFYYKNNYENICQSKN